jgi:hypothetical protein
MRDKGRLEADRLDGLKRLGIAAPFRKFKLIADGKLTDG